MDKRDRNSEFFYAWEKRGRGTLVYPEPVLLEPPFVPFIGHGTTPVPFRDDLSVPKQRFPIVGKNRKPQIKSTPTLSYREQAKAQYPIRARKFKETNPHLIEIQLGFSERKEIPIATFDQFLNIFSSAHRPVAFEIIGTEHEIIVQFTCRKVDEALLSGQISAFFPDAVMYRTNGYLSGFFSKSTPVIYDLALQEEFIRPISSPKRLDFDPLTGCYGILEGLNQGEIGGIQVLFQKSKINWGESIQRSVLTEDNKAFFPDSPEMVPLAKEKSAYPLFAAVVRTFGRGKNNYRSQSIAKELANTLQSETAYTGSNSLITLSNKTFNPTHQKSDLLKRQSHRLGFLINSHELISLVHFPAPKLFSQKLVIFTKSVEAPKSLNNPQYTLGINEHQGTQKPVGLPIKVRQRHIHLLGKTGQGKSTLMVNLVSQDIKHGKGCAVFDPHGDLIEDILSQTPAHLKNRIVMVDPGDSNYIVGINLLGSHRPQEKARLASDLALTFKRYTSAWGQNMNMVFTKAVGAFIKSTRGGTLLDLYRFLSDEDFREEFLETVQDYLILDFWENRFSKEQQKAAASVADRIDAFMSKDVIRYMFMQQKGLDFRKIMDDGKILLLRLSQGDADPSASNLLGSLILRKLYMAALTRIDTNKVNRRPFTIYLDEFQNFVTEDLGQMLSEIRKFGISIVMANQFLQQVANVNTAVSASVLNNPDTRLCFNIGTQDARQLLSSFPNFTAEDFTRLRPGQVIAYSAGSNFTLTSPLPQPVERKVADRRIQEIRKASRANYATPIAILKQQEKQIFAKKSSQPLVKQPLPSPVKPSVSKDISGTLHDQMKAQVISLGKKRGFIEYPEALTPDKKGLVDIVLAKGKLTVAIEVSSTNRNEYEAQNIKKCIQAGYDYVIWYSRDKQRFAAIMDLIRNHLTEQELQRVFLVDDTTLPSTLDKLTPRKGGEVNITIIGNQPKDRTPFWQTIIKTNEKT
jgi:hypothetical protein